MPPVSRKGVLRIIVCNAQEVQLLLRARDVRLRGVRGAQVSSSFRYVRTSVCTAFIRFIRSSPLSVDVTRSRSVLSSSSSSGGSCNQTGVCLLPRRCTFPRLPRVVLRIRFVCFVFPAAAICRFTIRIWSSSSLLAELVSLLFWSAPVALNGYDTIRARSLKLYTGGGYCFTKMVGRFWKHWAVRARDRYDGGTP